jgi:phosphomannomutase
MVASAVSSKMIEAMAAAEGFKFAECLTGSVSVWLVTLFHD